MLHAVSPKTRNTVKNIIWSELNHPSSTSYLRWHSKPSFDCLLYRCQKIWKSINVRQSYSKPKVGRFSRQGLIVDYWADLQSVHGFRCYDTIAPNAKCQRVLVLALCLVLHLDLKFGKTTFGYLVVTSAVFSLHSRAVHKFYPYTIHLSSI